MNFAGPMAGVLVAGAISNLSLFGRFHRGPFGDDRAKASLLWFMVVLVDLAAFGTFAAGYGVIEGLEEPNLSGLAGWALTGAAVPLALRSPVRQADIGGAQRPVGLTYVYDWIRAQFEDPLDGRLTELRRREEKATAKLLLEKGITFEQAKGELIEHINRAHRFSEEDKIRLRDQIETLATLPSPSNLRGLVLIASENHAGAVIEGLLDGA